MGEGWQLDARDLHWLRRACAIEDAIGALQATIARDGEMTTGSKGQPVLNPAIGEVRQLALAQARLLGMVEMEDPALKIAQARARTAARTAEWRKRARLLEGVS